MGKERINVNPTGWVVGSKGRNNGLDCLKKKITGTPTSSPILPTPFFTALEIFLNTKQDCIIPFKKVL